MASSIDVSNVVEHFESYLPAQKLIGLLMLFVASFVFIYYTTWVMLMPFVDQGHPLHELFPAREWAIRIPVILLLTGGTLVGSFLGFIMVKSAQKKAIKSKAK